MTFSLLDGKRSWHPNPPIFTPDRSHFTSLGLPEVAVPRTPEGQCIYPHPDPTHHHSIIENSSVTHTTAFAIRSNWPQTPKHLVLHLPCGC